MTGMVWSVGAVLTNGNRPYCHILPATGHLASEQALLFGRAARERASERRGRKGKPPPRFPPLSRLLSCASRSSTFRDIPQMKSLLASYWRFDLKIQKDFEYCCDLETLKFCLL